MSQECGFFNAQLAGEEYDRVYLAEQFAAYFASFIGNGVFGNSMQELEVLANDNMTTTVLSGQAWINGYWYRNNADWILEHQVADGRYPRIDIIVLTWDSSQRDMYLDVITGTPATNPIKPSLRRNADYFDLQLAEVLIPAGSTKISQENIEDTRLDSSVCGIVTGLIDQIDTTGLYNQFEAYFSNWKQNQQADYETWTQSKQSLYNSWVELMQQSYTEWIENTEEDFTTWIINHQADFVSWIEEHQQEFEEWQDSEKTSFAEWVSSLHDILDSEVATHLQNEIEELNERIDNIDMNAENVVYYDEGTETNVKAVLDSTLSGLRATNTTAGIENYQLAIGITDDGKYGYYKAGADTVTPFREPGGNALSRNVTEGVTFSNSTDDEIEGELKEISDLTSEMSEYTLYMPYGQMSQGHNIALQKVKAHEKDFICDENGFMLLDIPAQIMDDEPVVIPDIMPQDVNGKIIRSYNYGYHSTNYESESSPNAFPYTYQSNAVLSTRVPVGAKIVDMVTPKGITNDSDKRFVNYIYESSEQPTIIKIPVISSGSAVPFYFALSFGQSSLKCGFGRESGQYIENSKELLTYSRYTDIPSCAVSVYKLSLNEYLILYNTFNSNGYHGVVYGIRATVNMYTSTITYGSAIEVCANETSTAYSDFTVMRSLCSKWYFMIIRRSVNKSTGVEAYSYNTLSMNPNTVGNITIGSTTWTTLGDTRTYNYSIQKYMARNAGDNNSISRYLAHVERRHNTTDVTIDYCMYRNTVTSASDPDGDTLGIRGNVTSYDESTGVATVEPLVSYGTLGVEPYVWNLHTKLLIQLHGSIGTCLCYPIGLTGEQENPYIIYDKMILHNLSSYIDYVM